MRHGTSTWGVPNSHLFIPYSHMMGCLCIFVGALWFLALYACFQYETWHIAGVCLILICWYNMRHGTYGVYLILICFAIWTCVMSLSGGNASCHSYPLGDCSNCIIKVVDEPSLPASLLHNAPTQGKPYGRD